MNAHELANFLETDCWYKLITRHDIATMLRQQQAEIESLLKFVDERGETGQLIIWKVQEK